MEIYIKTSDSIKIQILNINPKISISEFKRAIQKATKIPTQSQIIHHDNKDISNIRTLTLTKLLETQQRTDTSNSSSVDNIIIIPHEFFVQNSNLIKISIRTPNDRIIRLSVNGHEMRVIELQEKLKTLTGIPVQLQAIYHKDVNLSSSQRTLLQLGIFCNAQLILWDKQDNLQIFIQPLLPDVEEISILVSPYATLMEIQNRLEGITGIPINCQLFTRNGINLTPQSNLTIRQLRITSNERFVLYDKFGIIEITIIMPNQKKDILKVRRNSTILDLQKKLEELTGIPIAYQIISQGNLDLSLSEQTFCQLKTVPKTEFVLQNKMHFYLY